MTITIDADGGYHGEVFQDGDRWGYRIHECLFVGNKNADPDFQTFEPSRRFCLPSTATSECLEEIEWRQAADKKRAESAPAGGNEYNPFEVTA